MKTVQAFEEVATTVLESLNEADPEKRRAVVKGALDALFNPGQRDKYLTPFDIHQASPAENPQGWLVYCVLNILDHPSEEITPVGRLRALELLEIYSAKELAGGFRSEKYKTGYYNGYDQLHIPRLPHSFCSREERLQANHKDIWKNNINIKKLIVRAGDYGPIDWRATATAITQKPEEAIQVLLLFMHSHELTEGALGILRSIPQLDRETLSRMFGERATFLIEHKIAQGMDIEQLVKVGAGIERDPTKSTEEEQLKRLTPEEMLQKLRREQARVRDLEEELVYAEAQIAQLRWEQMQFENKIRRQEAELNHWRAGKKPPEYQAGTSEIDRLDPKGYYRILGLHPSFFEELSEEAIQKLIQSHYRVLAGVHHPDVGGSNEKMQLLNEAREVLRDPEKRKRYGK